MKQTITIKGVDVKILEEQRLIISNIFNDSGRLDENGDILLMPEEVEALLGVSNMLDAWSDEIYWKKYTGSQLK